MAMQATRHLTQVIGANIASVRAEKKLSRRAFGDEIGVDQMLVYKWERGLHRPSDVNLAALVSVTGKDAAWFYTDHREVAA